MSRRELLANAVAPERLIRTVTQPRLVAIAALLAVGIVSAILRIGLDYPFVALDERMLWQAAANDEAAQLLALLVSLVEPIDWSRPLAIDLLMYPEGTSLVLADAAPLISLPLRVAWSAGLRFDAPLLFSLFPLISLVVAPLAVARLARALGAGWIGATAAGIAGHLFPMALDWASQQQHGLTFWWLLPLLIAELLEWEGAARPLRKRSAVLLFALWWANAYLGLMGTALVLVSGAAVLLRRRSTHAALWLIIASLLAPLTLIGLGGLRGDYAEQLPRIGMETGVFTSFAFLTGGNGPPVDAILRWGPLLGVLGVVGITALFRRAPGVAASIAALAFIAIHADSGLLLLPDLVFSTTSLGGFVLFISRLFLPAALIGVAWAGALISSPRSGALLRALLLAGMVLITADGLGALVRASGRLMSPRMNGSYPETLRVAERSLINEHELVFVTPPFYCYAKGNPPQLGEFPFWGLSQHLALVAAETGVPTSSTRLARYPLRDCNASPPPHSLLLAWRDAPVPSSYTCLAEPPDLYRGIGATLCSENRAAIERFERSVR